MTTQIKNYLSKTYGMEFINVAEAGYLYEQGRTMAKGSLVVCINKSHPSIGIDRYNTISINYYVKGILDDDYDYGPESLKYTTIIFGDKTMEQIVEEVETYCLLNGPEWLKRSITINKIIN